MSRDLPTFADVDLGSYDFLDFGSGTGNSIGTCRKYFGADRGLGVEISREKILAARRKGREVIYGDIRAIPDETRVRFVSMMDFLEHLPTKDDVCEILQIAVRCAKDFVFIRHPSFEDEAYLEALGLRQYWHNWRGHPSHILLAEFAEMFEQAGVKAWTARFKFPTFSSDDNSIIPVAAPIDQLRYDPDICGPKPTIRFARPIYRQIDLIGCLSPEAFAVAPDLLRAVAGQAVAACAYATASRGA